VVRIESGRQAVPNKKKEKEVEKKDRKVPTLANREEGKTRNLRRGRWETFHSRIGVAGYSITLELKIKEVYYLDKLFQSSFKTETRGFTRGRTKA